MYNSYIKFSAYFPLQIRWTANTVPFKMIAPTIWWFNLRSKLSWNFFSFSKEENVRRVGRISGSIFLGIIGSIYVETHVHELPDRYCNFFEPLITRIQTWKEKFLPCKYCVSSTTNRRLNHRNSLKIMMSIHNPMTINLPPCW